MFRQIIGVQDLFYMRLLFKSAQMENWQGSLQNHCRARRPKRTESLSTYSVCNVLLITNLQGIIFLPLECMQIVVFITNLHEVPVFAARIHVDGVFSV